MLAAQSRRLLGHRVDGAETKLGVQPRLVRLEPPLLEPLGLETEAGVEDVGERPSPPEADGGPEERDGAHGVVGSQRTGSLAGELLEPMRVDFLRGEVEHIPGLLPPQPRAVAEPPPHLRDVHLHRVGRARGRRLPEELDQPLGRNHPPRVERQGGDESALLPGRDRDRAAVLSDFDRPQEPHLHGGDDDTRGSG